MGMTLAARHQTRPRHRVRLPGMGIGRVTALLGAAIVWLGLSQPFYTLTLPRGTADALVSGFGADPLSQMLARFLGAATLQAEGGLGIDAWTAFERVDLLLGIGAAAAAALVVLGALGQVTPALLQVVWAAGLGGLGLVAYRMVDRPLPAEVLTVDRGAWTLLVGCGLLVVGGWLVAARD
jgi:hypothetical protein